MLILKCKSGQLIRIGTDVMVYVFEVGNKQVKLGIHAPQGLEITRDYHAEPTQSKNPRSNA